MNRSIDFWLQQKDSHKTRRPLNMKFDSILQLNSQNEAYKNIVYKILIFINFDSTQQNRDNIDATHVG